jgi:hypothetical protein
MSRSKAPEVLRNEAYIEVRCNDEGQGERWRWAFFIGRTYCSKVAPVYADWTSLAYLFR